MHPSYLQIKDLGVIVNSALTSSVNVFTAAYKANCAVVLHKMVIYFVLLHRLLVRTLKQTAHTSTDWNESKGLARGRAHKLPTPNNRR